MTFAAGQRLTAAVLNAAFNNTMQLISKQVLTGSFPSVSFGSIPQTYTNLRLVVSMKTDGTSTNGYDPVTMQFNNVNTSSYGGSSYWLVQGGTSLSVTSASPATSMPVANSWNAHFGSPGRGIATIDIPNYSDTNNAKSFTSQSSAADGGSAGIFQSYSGTYNGTAAITSITLLATGNFVADSTFTLYGS